MPPSLESPHDAPPLGDQQSIWTLPGPVWLLGWVSLFTDSASEAIYAILPFFLTRVLGATVVSVGIIEGAAEAANSLLKVGSGYFSDRFGLKRPIVLAGYAISSAIRPLTGLVTIWEQVLAIRFVDRIGKGIRGAPRDAMLASWARPETRGRVYGFHRAMDNTGAVVGPLFAAAFLVMFPGRYRELFGMTVIPGAIAVALLLRLPEAPATRAPAPPAATAAAPPPIRFADLPRPL
ncbi:MAG TPA: MFS transporter, partial [Vicinamibacterales bacterium]|nr:MFS transporter [Vicinamibacterales bacterium]